MYGDAYTPESSSPSQSPTPNRTPSPPPPRNGYVNGSTNGDSKTVTRAASYHNGLETSDQSSKHTTFFGHDREQVARILIQGLQDLGYRSSAQALGQESGFELESSSAAAFRSAVLSGKWNEAEALLFRGTHEPEADNVPHANGGGLIANGHKEKTKVDNLALNAGADRDEMLFLIRQQKYLELLEKGDVAAGLACLRQELHPLHQNQRQLHALSSLIMCRSPEEVKTQAAWDGADGTSRRQLLSNLSSAISPSVMIPEHRLARLLDQWKDYQLQGCLYHNTSDAPSLYVDHSCTREDLPLHVLAELDHHTNEVWFVQFSNDGKLLATAGQDKTIVIYDTANFRRRHVLSEHRKGVVSVAFSPDDKTLVSCSQDNEARLWDTNTGRCLRVLKLHTDPVTSAAWAPDGQSFVLGSMDLSRPLSIWPLHLSTNEAAPTHTFEKSCNRVQDCAVAEIKAGSRFESGPISGRNSSSAQIRLAAMCVDKTVSVFDYARHEKLKTINIGHALTCVSLSNDGQEMLVNLNCNEIWSMGVEDGEVRQKYQGQKQGAFVIRSCYGGATEGFVVSGGEDGKICVWHRHTGRLLEQLDGHHPACVNTVAWNKANSGMFASAGDDSKVRVWTALRSDTTIPEVFRSSRNTSNTASNGDESSGRGVPRWGPTFSGGAANRFTSLMRRQA